MCLKKSFPNFGTDLAENLLNIFIFYYREVFKKKYFKNPISGNTVTPSREGI